MKFIKRRKKKLEKYSTNELIGELLTREGVDAKYAIEDGLVYVNGEQAFQRGKKLVDGDVVTYEGQTIKIIK